MAYTEAWYKIGLLFSRKPDKPIQFIGRDAHLASTADGMGSFPCRVEISDPGPPLYHDETVVRDGKIPGNDTTGVCGCAAGSAAGLRLLVSSEEERDDKLIKNSLWSVSIEEEEITAEVAEPRSSTSKANAR